MSRHSVAQAVDRERTGTGWRIPPGQVSMIRQQLARHLRFCLHFTPTGARCSNPVQRQFAPLSEKQIRLGAHRSTAQHKR